MGPEQYGVYGLALSIFAVFQPFINYGADDLLLQDVINDEKETKKKLGSILFLKACLACFSYTVMIVTLYLLGDIPEEVYGLVFILGIYNFFNALSVIEVYLQSKMNFRIISYSRFLAYIITSLLKLMIVFYKLPMLFLGIVFVLEMAMLRLMMCAHQQRLLRGLSVSYSYAFSFFKKTWPYLVTVVVLVFNQRVGVFFITKYQTLEVLGNYNVLITLTRFFDFIPLSILAVILPKIIETKKRDYGQYNYRMSAVYFIMLLIGVGLAGGFVIFSELLVTLFYGERFIALASLIPLGFLGVTITFLNFAKARHFVLEERPREWMFYNIMTTILLIGFNFYLTKFYGIEGAICSYIGSYLMADIVFFVFSKKYREIYLTVLQSFLFPFKFFKKRI